jgi:hypothetical protein
MNCSKVMQPTRKWRQIFGILAAFGLNFLHRNNGAPFHGRASDNEWVGIPPPFKEFLLLKVLLRLLPMS